jgi:hypothetical protein
MNDNDHDDDGDQGGSEIFLVLEHFADAIIALRDLVLNAKVKPAALKKLARLNRQYADVQAKFANVEADAAQIVAKAQADVAAIHEQAQRRLEAAATAEDELVQREAKIARLENSWRNLGEPADVMSGFRSPEFSPLQKARLAHGRPPGKDVDVLGLSAQAEPDLHIDIVSDTHDDPHADRHGASFLGELTRDVSHHKRQGAA